jgi:hypothetical protein
MSAISALPAPGTGTEDAACPFYGISDAAQGLQLPGAGGQEPLPMLQVTIVLCYGMHRHFLMGLPMGK